MIKRCTIDDLEFVDAVLTHPAIYPHISDDYSPSIKEFTAKPLLKRPACYVLMYKDYGLVLSQPMNGTMFDTHITMLPEHRGKDAIEASDGFAHYLFTETTCEKIMAIIPELFPNVMNFVQRIGFKAEGHLTKSIKKNGKLIDQYVFGLEKILWQQRQ